LRKIINECNSGIQILICANITAKNFRMAVTRIDVETFISLGFRFPVIDVRSEGEFAQAHIPGAVSMPLFNNDERKIVGTIYKQQGKQQAIKIGLALFGKKMVNMVEYVESIFEKSEPETTPKTIVIHCWRGGMRSGGVSWMLDLYGFKVYTIVGGYKAFRQWVIKQFEKKYPLKLIGGYTGSGKTVILHELKKQQDVVIDLEDLAKHKGSAFGNIDMPAQPTQEMFENLFALELKFAEDRLRIMKHEYLEKVEVFDKSHSAESCDTEVSTFLAEKSPVQGQSGSHIWLEDESQRLGHVNIPVSFFKKMRNSPLYFLDIPFEERLQHIVREYGRCDKQELVDAIYRIQKKLGGLETKTAIKFLMEDNLLESFRILLKYYDKQYLKGLNSRENVEDLVTTIECNSVDALQNLTHIFARQTGAHV
jgi:tRNA 2-selenouridine synthase